MGATSQIPGRAVTSMPVNQSGIALPDPTHTAGSNCMVSRVITVHLTAALHGAAGFRSGDHALLMREGKDDICRWHTEDSETSLGETQASVSTYGTRRMGRITRMGEWLAVIPSTANEI